LIVDELLESCETSDWSEQSYQSDTKKNYLLKNK
jgi:hypothetical protein